VTGSACMAQYRGDYRGEHGDGGRHSYHGYSDGDRHYGYYRNSRGELIFGLLGIGVAAAIVSTIEGPPVYVQQPVVVYQEPPVVQRPIVVQQQPQVVYVQTPQVVQQPVPAQQPVQVVPPQPASVTIRIQNSNGSYTPVTLHPVGTQWVGPKGEYYDVMPSVGQLRPVYGF